VGPAPFRWRAAALAFGVLLVVGGSVGAARGSLRAWAARHGFVASEASPVETERPRSLPAHRIAPPVAPSPSLAPEPIAIQALPAAAPPRTIALASATKRLRSSAPLSTSPVPLEEARVEPPVAVEAPLPAASPAAEEARLLEGVFHALRSETDGAARALAALDDHDRRFPAGLMRAEAALARVEALLALGRRAEALALLDAPEAGTSLPRSARLARGELRAEAGRCSDAAGDFAVVLRGPGDDLSARALYGRASCALRSGDDASAAAALSAYLERQPDGPHAAEARTALARLRALTP
jgi:hypothetical protein